MIIEKLKKIENEYHEIENLLSNPNVIADSQKLKDLSKRRKEILPVAEKYQQYKKLTQEISHINEILVSDDLEMIELAKTELIELERKKNMIELELKQLLKPQSPLDKKNIIVEIRAAAGGEESSLFASDLYRMYTRYAESKKFNTEILSVRSTGLGGIKEIIFIVEGNGAYGLFKYESGTHRVQRVPKTEAAGRIHTSTVTVAVLVEPDEVEVEIKPTDLRIDTYRAGGHGGQYLQKTDSAVRITHIPTNTVVVCQDERSQLKNKLKAMKILKARLYDTIKIQRQQNIDNDRKKQVGTGERSEKIRTYNFPQDRITDHRLNDSFHNIQNILDGNMDIIMDKFKKIELL
ncbi:MAG: peptide chain release factor 1 [Elusimicrobiota bacterium]